MEGTNMAETGKWKSARSEEKRLPRRLKHDQIETTQEEEEACCAKG